MLPSRLFKNVGIPPALRAPLLLHPRLSPTVRVQLLCHLRLDTAAPSSGVRRLSTTTPRLLCASPSRTSATNLAASSSQSPQKIPAVASDKEAVKEESQEPRLQLTFTCAVEGCADRSTHTFTRRAYERGIVIVQCPSCKNRHLIADHLGWFKSTEGTGEGKFRTIEDIMQARGEKVKRGRMDVGGVVEYAE